MKIKREEAYSDKSGRFLVEATRVDGEWRYARIIISDLHHKDAANYVSLQGIDEMSELHGVLADFLDGVSNA